jgi:hypothetical protein
MTESIQQTETTVRDIQRFVSDWYVALDRHVPFEEVEQYLVDGEIRFVFPESTVTTHDGLFGWYDTVTRKFFDEAHRVDLADVQLNGDGAQVHVVVNWRTRVWDPPAATSRTLEYEADQDWGIVIGPDGRPRLHTYVVNDLIPRGDTPPLF